MKTVPALVFVLLKGIISLSSAALFLETEALFIRTTGQPQEEIITFSVHNPTIPYKMVVQNGPDGYFRISSASVSLLLNNQEIFSSNDFNQQVEWLEKPVTVSNDNTLRVLLTSKPDGALKIWIYGDDQNQPTISINEPVAQSILNTDQPAITCSFSDVESACVPDSFKMMINGVDRTSFFAVDETTATTTSANPLSLPEGPITLLASIVDKAGNISSQSISFEIDLTPPAIIITSPGQDTILNHTPITIAYTADGEARAKSFSLNEGMNIIIIDSVDEAGNRGADTVRIELDTQAPEVAITSPADGYLTNNPNVHILWTVDGATFESDTVFTEGTHAIARSATDAAGNTGSAQITVTVDLTAPVVEITSPTDGFVTNQTPISVSWTVDGVAQTTQLSEDLPWLLHNL